MKIAIIGGGPAGLYFALLIKKARPEATVTVHERNRPEDTFGFGVVFSDETLGNFERADRESYERITGSFRYWRDIDTFYRGTRTVSTGHGFAAMARKKLLLILQERCREVGVELRFEEEIESLEAFARADLVVAADGINSFVRSTLRREFEPTINLGSCRFCWLGTDLPLEAFTFIFHETELGLFQVHAYPFDDEMATWIVECHEDTFAKIGLDGASEAETVGFAELLFRDYLDGHKLYANRSIWRTFPTVRCARWHHGNVVLLGDAAHTAHFSIGSGTKMAMEDAMLLAEAFAEHGTADVPRTLAAYQEGRWVDVLKIQKAARTSRTWFEVSDRYLGQPPVQFAFNLMTRSKQITWDNLAARDPELVARVAEWYAESVGDPPPEGEAAPPPIFHPMTIRDVELANRIVVSPMCQYSATDGVVDDWHLVHLGSRALGGAGLVLTEMTDVTADGRITHGCAGMYAPEHRDAWRRVVDFVHERSNAKIGLQLAHAGRKGSARHPWDGADQPLTADEGAWETIAPSPIPWDEGWPVPRQMNRDDMDRVTAAFVRAARWAEEAGFDLLELHMAHGYLLSTFLSPLTNRREDDYGGSLDNRARYPLEVLGAVRAAWPQSKPIFCRITGTDWMPDGSGVDAAEAVELARLLGAAGCDVVDVSSGLNVPEAEPDWGRMFQVPFAERIRLETGLPVAAVGALLGADHANTVLAAGRADLAVMARPHLRDPYLTLRAAARYGVDGVDWPGQYLPARPRPRDAS